MIAEDHDGLRPHGAARREAEPAWSRAVSMYTELLRAALDAMPSAPAAEDQEAFFADVIKRRRELAQDVPPELRTTEAVPVVLARQVGYDISLIRLAVCLGIETDPQRFEPTGRERTRLEEAFRDLGLGVGPAAWPAPYGDR
ncbi:MAG TPA: hypothetical protein VEH82_01905 [Acidimicrobiales bacterium]|nr:hypothetical protein [Acidimicrobiales bacterium]